MNDFFHFINEESVAQGQLVVRLHWAPGVEQTALWHCLPPVPILGSGSALRAAVFIYII